MSNWRRECISDLAVAGRLPTDKLPRIGEALYARDHAKREPRHAIGWKIPARGLIGDTEAVDTEKRPLPPRPCRAKIWAAVFL